VDVGVEDCATVAEQNSDSRHSSRYENT